MTWIWRVAILLGVSSPVAATAQEAPLATRLRQVVDSLRVVSQAPGITVGVVLPDGTELAFVSGRADTVTGEALRPDHRFLAGSVGKTWFAALAWQLLAERNTQAGACDAVE